MLEINQPTWPFTGVTLELNLLLLLHSLSAGKPDMKQLLKKK